MTKRRKLDHAVVVGSEDDDASFASFGGKEEEVNGTDIYNLNRNLDGDKEDGTIVDAEKLEGALHESYSDEEEDWAGLEAEESPASDPSVDGSHGQDKPDNIDIDIWSQAWRQASQQYAKDEEASVIQPGEIDEVNPWLRRTGWIEYLAGCRPKELLESVQPPAREDTDEGQDEPVDGGPERAWESHCEFPPLRIPSRLTFVRLNWLRCIRGPARLRRPARSPESGSRGYPEAPR